LSGAKVAAVTGSTALLGHFAATRFSPAYRKLQLSFKVFLISSAFMAGFFTETDRAAMAEDRAFMQKFSISKEDELNHRITRSDTLKSYLDPQELQKAFVRNRYEVVGYGYVGVVGSTLLYNFSRTG
jgi:hypothetical protein